MDYGKLIEDIANNKISDIKPDMSRIIKGPGLKASGTRQEPGEVICGVSVRHVHLSRKHADILFGEGYEMQILKELYQPGAYAYKETVTLVGPKLNTIQNVRVLGPLRNKTQIELAKTDCIVLGINAPVKPSGELEGSVSAVVVGPRGVAYLKDGVIRANRHLHISDKDADYFGIKNNDLIDVRISGSRGLTFNNVQVRVTSGFKPELHIDTDDGNAADITNGTIAEIVDSSCISPISTK